MAANVVTKARSYNGSQAGSFVDIVTFTNKGDSLLVDNRSTTVHISLTFTTSEDTTANAAPTPTYLGDDTFYVPASGFRVFPFPVSQVKLIGSTTAMAYTVAVL